MKYLFATLLIGLFSFSLYSQSENREIVFEEKVHNFGAVYENKGKVSHTFIFWNKGKIPLVIERVYASCGCTSYDYIKSPVKPGEKGRVTVTFNPLYR
ncbi:MAG TPA: DUF1573 domain-containing protein, partial [Bacteroidales bacterium]|nr:DUF1573 domain-containing protein [Bacteroidales bacterium]